MQNVIRLDLGTVNAYLLPVGSEFVLIDTGGYTFMDSPVGNRCSLLEEQLQKHGCVPGKLKLIILTHGDVDHSGNAKYLQEKYGAKVAVHKDDADLLHDLTLDKIFSNFKFDSLGMTLMGKAMHSLFVKISNKIIADYASFKADELIDDGFDPAKYNLGATILHLPGHTKGSIVILLEDGSLFAGDSLTNVKKPGIAMNAYDFPLLKKNVNTLKTMKINTVYPGHGTPFDFSELKLR